MNKLLGFLFLFVAIDSFAQTTNSVRSQNEMTDTVISPSTDINKLIIAKYCSDYLSYQIQPSAINLYNSKISFQLAFNPNVVAIYNPSLVDYSFYPTTRKPYIESNYGRGSGMIYGSTNTNSFNPYGASTPSEAIVLGSLNFFLNKAFK